MIHIRRLLESAAPEPVMPFDAVALVARARRPRPARRWAAWGAGVIAVVGGGVGMGSLAPADNGESTIRQLPGVTTTTAVASEERHVESLSGGGDGAPSMLQHPSTTVSAVPANLSIADRGGQTVAPTDDSGEEGCRAKDGERCEYDATKPGGYRSDGNVEIWIVRNGQTSYYNTAPQNVPPGDRACGDTGFVQPGDHVIVQTSKPWEGSDTHVVAEDDPGLPDPPPSWVEIGTFATCPPSWLEGASG